MPVRNTYKWLVSDYEKPERICEHFTPYIPLTAREIYAFLVTRGMYRPYREGRKELKKLAEQKVWLTVQKEFAALRAWLKGPNVPIYILPSNVWNRYIEREYNGKAGLALSSCIFLFVSSRTTSKELQAMLTHEYHHVCRLNATSMDEENGTLLDTMIMEGLAEAAVKERHGDKWHAPWVSYYTKKESVIYWNELKRYYQVKRYEPIHDALLNGTHRYPKMLGYAIGYYIVQDCIDREKLTSTQLLPLDAKTILQYAKTYPLSFR